jgi:hypothetical protein
MNPLTRPTLAMPRVPARVPSVLSDGAGRLRCRLWHQTKSTEALNVQLGNCHLPGSDASLSSKGCSCNRCAGCITTRGIHLVWYCWTYVPAGRSCHLLHGTQVTHKLQPLQTLEALPGSCSGLAQAMHWPSLLQNPGARRQPRSADADDVDDSNHQSANGRYQKSLVLDWPWIAAGG